MTFSSKSILLCATLTALLANACDAGISWNSDDSDDDSDVSPNWNEDDGSSGRNGGGNEPGGGGGTGVVDTTNDETEVDRWKELLVVDPSVLQDPRASNAVLGASWSFRSMMDRLSGDPARTPAFTEAWLQTYAASRPGVTTTLLDPWRQRSGCATTAPYGGTTPPCALAMDRAPFQLLAIVNRVDLAMQACAPGGEVRFVYNALDPETGAALPATFIFEFPLPATQFAGTWARAWHMLAKFELGASYAAALGQLTDTLLAGTNLAQAHLRSDELAFAAANDSVWELRDYGLQQTAGLPTLVQNSLTDTPDGSLDGSAALAQWIGTNQASVLLGTQTLPVSMQGSVARVPTASFGWTVPGVADTTRQAFSAATCNGCHGGDRVVGGLRELEDRLPFQQIAAPAGNDGYDAGPGTPQISTYLNEGNGGKDDELGRREGVLLTLVNTDCVGGSNVPTPSYGLHPRKDH